MHIITPVAILAALFSSPQQPSPWDPSPKMSFSVDATEKAVDGTSLFQEKLVLCDVDTYKAADGSLIQVNDPNPSYFRTINSGSLLGAVGAEYNSTSGVKTFTHSIIAYNEPPSPSGPGTPGVSVIYRQDTYTPTDNGLLRDVFAAVDKCVVTVTIKLMK